MKYIIGILIIGFAACNQQIEKSTMDESEIAYDSILAKKYGADDYGMKQYVMAFLKRGSNDTILKERAAELQKAHLENIQRMANEGQLVVAGPFLDNGDLRGIYILTPTSKMSSTCGTFPFQSMIDF